jgi:hypothetical protein
MAVWNAIVLALSLPKAMASPVIGTGYCAIGFLFS